MPSPSIPNQPLYGGMSPFNSGPYSQLPAMGQGDLLTFVIKGLDTIDDDLQQILAQLQKSGRNQTSNPLGFGGTVAASAVGTAIAVPIVGMFTNALSRIQGKAVSGGDQGGTILGKSLDLLGNALGTVLMPVIAVASAGLVALGESIFTEVVPHLAQFTADLIDGAEAVIEFSKGLASWVDDASEIMGQWFKEEGKNFEELGAEKAQKQWNRQHPGMQFFGPGDMNRPFTPAEIQGARPGGNPTKEAADRMAREAQRRQEGLYQTPAAGGAAGPAGSVAQGKPGTIAEAMRKYILPELEYSMGGKGGSFGLSKAWESAQLASRQSPFQAEMLRMMKITVEELGKGTAIAENNARKPQKAVAQR